MKRGGWIDRHTPMKKRRDRARRVAPDRVRSEEHRAKVRGLRVCASRGLPGAVCSGWDTIQASHRDEGKGFGMKDSDMRCIPQCHNCHRDWTDHQGPFAGWQLPQRREWFRGKVRLTLFLLGFSLEEVNRIQPGSEDGPEPPRTFAEDLAF